MVNSVFIRRYILKTGVSLIIWESWQLCSGLSYDHRFISKRLLAQKKKAVWWEETRLTSPEVQIAATLKAWRDSGRASAAPLHLRNQKETLLAGCNMWCPITANCQRPGYLRLYPVNSASFCVLEEGKRKLLPEFCQNFEVTAAQTSGPDNLVFPCQTGFSIILWASV